MLATIWQIFKYAAHAITGNGNYANLLELIYKKIVKSHQGTIHLKGRQAFTVCDSYPPSVGSFLLLSHCLSMDLDGKKTSQF